MKIGIDASRYGVAEATGVESYSRHIIDNVLLQISSDDEVVLYTRKKLELKNIKADERIKQKVIRSKRLWTLLGLSREIKREKPDVLFVPSHTFPMVLPERSVITIHDVAFRSLRKSYSFFQYHYLNWSTKFAVKKATKIIVPSQATKKDLIHFFKCPEEKIVVIPHGFSPPEISPLHKKKNGEVKIPEYFGIDDRTSYVLFVGRLESKKNLINLVRAFRDFSEIHSEFKLILAGKRGVGFKEIFKTTSELRLFDKVIMPGYINAEEKDFLFKHCFMFAFPSLYEGFGLPVLESFYYEKPVLISNVSSLPEVGKDAATYVDPYDAESIFEGMQKIFSDENYAKTKGMKGVKYLREFTWETAAEKTLKVLQDG